MRNIRKWVIPLSLLAAFIAAPKGTPAASLEDLVPGEVMADYELDPYYGKGTEGIDGGVNNNTGEIVQNNVDDFVTTIDASAGADQGFVNVFQISGDNAVTSVYITIDVNINGIEYGGNISGGFIDGGAGGALNIEGSTANLTATAEIESIFDTTSMVGGP